MPIEIKMPAITPDFDAGNISSWDKAVGDKVAKGDILVAIETDKAVIEVEAESAGILGQILIPAGTNDVPVHSLIGYLLIGNETIADLPNAPLAAKIITPTTDNRIRNSIPSECKEHGQAS